MQSNCFIMYQLIGDLDTHCIEQCLHHITQVAPDIYIGGGQRRRAPKIQSKLGGSGGKLPGNFYLK